MVVGEKFLERFLVTESLAATIPHMATQLDDLEKKVKSTQVINALLVELETCYDVKKQKDILAVLRAWKANNKKLVKRVDKILKDYNRTGNIRYAAKD